VEDAHRSRQFLEKNGCRPEYREYEMAHEINESVLADLTRWLH
jgi:predicted esterase